MKKTKEVKPPKNKGDVDEGSQTLTQPASRSTPDTRKRLREPTVSPEESISVRQGRKSTGMATYWGPCVARLFRRQTLIGSLRKAAMERRTGWSISRNGCSSSRVPHTRGARRPLDGA